VSENFVTNGSSLFISMYLKRNYKLKPKLSFSLNKKENYNKLWLGNPTINTRESNSASNE
jgi:hypothetical protein